MDLLADIVLTTEPDTVNCTGKGLKYRYYNSEYPTKAGFEHREGFRLLKRQSCLCPRCSWILDDWSEWVECGISYGKLRDGDICELVVHTSRDWETGYVDVDFVEMVKVNNEK